MHYDHINVPEDGEAITVNPDHTINVPDHPIIPYIEGDGIGSDVTPVMLNVVEAAVEMAYADRRHLRWMPVFAGQRATEVYGSDVWMPDETLDALRRYDGVVEQAFRDLQQELRDMEQNRPVPPAPPRP